MKPLSRLLHWLAIHIDPDYRRQREKAERKEPAVAFLQTGIVATLVLWGVIAVFAFLAEFGDIIVSYRDGINAIATTTIAVFTITLWFSTAKMQRVTSATLGHLEREFLATHRPELVVRSLFLTTMPDSDGASGLTKNYALTFWIVNRGQSSAIPVGIRTLALFGQEEMIAGRNGLLANPIGPWPSDNAAIVPGGNLRYDHRGEVNGVRLASIGAGWDQRSDVFLMGRLIYEDAAGARRELGFCRRYNITTGSSEVVDDPAWEYSD